MPRPLCPRFFSLVFVALLCHALGSNARAQLLAQESFDYTAGFFLSGQNGGTGFGGAWVAPIGIRPQLAFIQSPSLSFGALATGGNHADGGSGPSSRTLASSVNSGTLYIGGLVRPTFAGSTNRFGLDGSSNDVFFGTSAAGGSSTIGVGGGSTFTASSTSFIDNQTYFFVGRIDFNINSGLNDRIRLYINPTPGQTEPINAAVTLDTVDIGNITQLLLSSNVTDYDEFRIGRDFASVSLVAPEPSALALLLVALPVAGFIRRGRRGRRREEPGSGS